MLSNEETTRRLTWLVSQIRHGSFNMMERGIIKKHDGRNDKQYFNDWKTLSITNQEQYTKSVMMKECNLMMEILNLTYTGE